jgi:hypothetical protein
MSDIQRWGGIYTGDETMLMGPTPAGQYVLHADHVEALRQAEQGRLAVSPWAQRNWDEGYLAGQRDALAGAVQRVEALDDVPGVIALPIYRAAVIAAIEGAPPSSH